jgi:hypothetical protein
MNLYLLTQEVNRGYDTYDSCVVAAESAEDARVIQPREIEFEPDENFSWWVSPESVTVTFLGRATESIKRGVICASFNAG